MLSISSEETAYSLGGKRTISDLIPFVIQNAEGERDVSVTLGWDYPYGRGNGCGVTLWGQRLAVASSPNATAKSMSGKEVAREVIVVLATSPRNGPD